MQTGAEYVESLREALEAEAAKCLACTTGTMAGAIPGTLANVERCDDCETYASDEEARQALIVALTIGAISRGG